MPNKINLLLGVGLMALGAAGIVPGAAHAQQASAPATTAQAAGSGGLEEVVVTAQKRQENAQEVPIAIEAFNEHMLDSMQINNMDSVAEVTPGLNITRNLGSAYISLRGLILTGITVGNDPTVAVYVDGAYNPSASATTFTFNNIASVEVDKGPQGTLFGRNATGGVLNITTKDPSSTPHVDLNLGYANYNEPSISFYGTTGIAPNLSADLAAFADDQFQGWGKDLYNGQDVYRTKEWTGRSKWVYTPDDATKITATIDYDRIWDPMGGSTYSRGANNGVSPTPTTGPIHPGGFYDIYQDRTPYSWDEQYGASLKMQHDFGSLTGVSITSWRRNINQISLSSLITDFPGTGPQNPSNTSQQWSTREVTASQEFQALSPVSSPLKWVGGLYLFQDEAGSHPLKTTYLSTNAACPGTAPATCYLYDQQNTTSYAAFGQATAPITPDTRVTLGYRYTLDSRSINGAIYTSTGAVVPGSTGSTGNSSKKWPKSTYKIALDHDFAQDFLGYITYSRGFQSGEFNAFTGPSANVVNPEVLDAYETGFKADFMDHSLRLNASVFYYDFTNQIVSIHLINPAQTLNLNAAEASYKGLDLDLTAAPTKNLTIQFGAELLSPYYTSFPNATVFVPTANPLTNSAVNGNDTGKQVAYTETATADVNAQYRIPMETGDVQLASDLTYHQGLVMDPQNAYKQDPYFLLNASMLWTAPSGMWDVKLWGKNLTSTQVGGQGQIGGNPARYQAATAPLTYGINVGYHWN